MDINEEIYDLIERYLNGELQEAERLDFERKIESIPELKEEIKLQKELQHFFDGTTLGVEESDVELENFLDSKEANDVQDLLNKTLKNQKEKKENNTSENKKRSWKIFALPVAASVLLLVGFFYVNSLNSDPEDIFAEYNAHENLSITNKGNTEEILSKIENDFNSNNKKKEEEKNYAELENLIASLLDTLSTNDSNWSTLKLTEGIVALELNKNDEASTTFQELKNSDYLNADQAAWYYILTLLNKGEKENAILEINELLDSNYKYKEKELKEILKDLN